MFISDYKPCQATQDVLDHYGLSMSRIIAVSLPEMR